jgi:hypothetical protein
MLDQAKNLGLEGLSKIAAPLERATNADLLSMDFVKGATIPLTMAASEQAYNTALDAQREFELANQGFQDFTGQQLADFSAGRKAAILASMGRAGFGEDEISATLAQLGLRNGGIISLMGGGMPSMEMDYRGGGFIPVGAKERADDVPARLSKNEFVMTADAVRAAGGGSVNEGARRMYELMNNLEARA